MKVLGVVLPLVVLLDASTRVVASNLRSQSHDVGSRQIFEQETNILPTKLFQRRLSNSTDSFQRFINAAVLKVPDLSASQETWVGTFNMNVTGFRCFDISYQDVKMNLISAATNADQFQLEIMDLMFQCEMGLSWSYRALEGAGTAQVISDKNYLSTTMSTTNAEQQPTEENTCGDTDIEIDTISFTGNLRVLNLFSLFIRQVAEATLKRVFCDLMSQEMLGMALQGTEDMIQQYTNDVPEWRFDPLYKETSMGVSGDNSFVRLHNDYEMGGLIDLATDMLNNLLTTKKWDPTTPGEKKKDYGLNTFLRNSLMQDRVLVDNTTCRSISSSKTLVNLNVKRTQLRVYGLDTAQFVTPFTPIGTSTLQTRLKWDFLAFEMDVTAKMTAATSGHSFFENATAMEPVVETFTYKQNFTGLDLLASFFVPLKRNEVKALPMSYFLDWGYLPFCLPPVLFGMEVAGLNLTIGEVATPVLEGIESSDVDEISAKAIQIGMAAFGEEIVSVIETLAQTEARDAFDQLIASYRCPVERRRLLEGEEEEEEEFVPPSGKELYINLLCVLGCVCTAALAAGLTMGLLSLDELMLLIKQRAGATEKERKAAERLLPIVRKHHLLLVSLLLMNAMANEALPLFLDKIVPGYVAVILSVTLVLFFGEIIPSALFTGPDQVNLASNLAPLVNFVMIILSPIAWPIAKVLDYLLHEHDEGGYNKQELSALVRIQYEAHLAAKRQRKSRINSALKQFESLESFDSYASRRESARSVAPEIRQTLRAMKKQFSQRHTSSLLSNDDLHVDEVTMVEGALQMGTTEAIDVYTPWSKVFAIPSVMKLTERNQVRIYRSGYSRIPVYKKNDDDPDDNTSVVGVLVAKQLMVIDSQDKRTVSTLPLSVPRCVSPHTTLVDLVNIFQSGGVKGSHMALVCGRPEKATASLKEGLPIPEEANLMGIVTLEDVLENLIQEEIYDEFDRKEKQRLRLARWGFQRWRAYAKKQKKTRGETVPRDSTEPRMLAVVEEAMADHHKNHPTETTSLLGRLNPFR